MMTHDVIPAVNDRKSQLSSTTWYDDDVTGCVIVNTNFHDKYFARLATQCKHSIVTKRR